AGDIELSASTDASEVALDGTLLLRIAASYASRGETGEVKLPAFADFELVGEPSRSEQMSFTFSNGSPTFRRTVTTTVALTPKRIGDLTIEPAKLEARGKTYQTPAIHVKVLPAGQARSGRAPDPLASDRPADIDP